MSVVLDENEDFTLTAHVEADGQQRTMLEGYLIKHKSDGIYRTHLIPELFYGVNGQQLETWSQYLTAGDHVILRRTGGNPHVPDHELNWVKISSTPTQTRSVPAQQPIQAVPSTPVRLAVDTTQISYAIIGGIIFIGVLYFFLRKK